MVYQVKNKKTGKYLLAPDGTNLKIDNEQKEKIEANGKTSKTFFFQEVKGEPTPTKVSSNKVAKPSKSKVKAPPVDVPKVK